MKHGMMRKTVALIFVCATLLALTAAALADVPIGTEMEVTGCESYITLRYGPSTDEDEIDLVPLGERVFYLGAADNGFACVGTRFGWGYVQETYLTMAYAPMGGCGIGDELTAEERYNINLFVSNFTEADFAWGSGYFNGDNEAEMVDFAINHIWFNQRDKIEWLEGTDEYNVRLDVGETAPVMEKYFGYLPECFAPTYVDWIDDGYYWTETGGHMKSGFAQETAVQTMDDGVYEVWFEVYGDGENWSNECCGYTIDEARATFPESRAREGYAMIAAEDLSDRSTFRLIRYAISRG